MAGLDDLNADLLADLVRRVRVLETAAPVGFTVVSRGALEIRSPEGLIVDGSAVVDGQLNVTGTETVTGTLTVSGILNGDGTLTWTGPATFTGETNLNGTTTQNGPLNVVGLMTVTGNSDFNGIVNIDGPLGVNGLAFLRGDTEVSGNLKVIAGGHVQIGEGLSLEPLGAGGGTINFLPSGSISAGLGKLMLIPPDLSMVVTIGAGSFDVSAGSSTHIRGLLYNEGITPIGASANMYHGSDNRIYKITSASRFKLDAHVSDFPDSILDVPVKDWLDAGQVERGEETRRIPGVIAEEVEAAGGELFVTYDPDGVIEGVAYDRLAIARTEVLARKLDAALARIDELEKRLGEAA